MNNNKLIYKIHSGEAIGLQSTTRMLLSDNTNIDKV